MNLVTGDGSPAQALRFVCAGVCNALFGYGVFAVATLAGASGGVALAIATVAGVAFNFQTARRIVFLDAPEGRALRFVAVYAILFLANWAALVSLKRIGMSPFLAQAILLAPFAALSFLMQKLAVFGADPGATRLPPLAHFQPANGPDAIALRLFVVVIGCGAAAFLVEMLAQPAYGAAACVLMAASLWPLLTARSAGQTVRVDYRLWGAAIVLALILCLLGGEGRLLYANTDWQIRDAVLADLSRRPWPVAYARMEGGDWILRAPVGMYILPALAGRLLGWQAAQPVLLIQNAALLAGVLAVFMSAATRWRARLLTAAVFVLFSGWDIVGQLIFNHFAQPAAWAGLFPHLESWARGLQYSSLMTDLFWAPNHALPAWVMLAAYLCWRRGTVSWLHLAAVTGLCLLWSPLAVMGATPFVILAGLSDYRRGRMGWLAPAWLAPLAAAMLPIALYLTLGADRVQHGATAAAPAFPLFYGMFIPLEAAPLIWLAWRHVRGEPRGEQGEFWLATAMLLLIPLYKIGNSNDFMMRASIFPITLLAAMTAKALATDLAERRWRDMAAPVLVLAIGAATPAAEVIRAFAEPPNPPNADSLFEAWQAPAHRGASKATYLAPAAAYARWSWLLKQP